MAAAAAAAAAECNQMLYTETRNSDRVNDRVKVFLDSSAVENVLLVSYFPGVSSFSRFPHDEYATLAPLLQTSQLAEKCFLNGHIRECFPVSARQTRNAFVHTKYNWIAKIQKENKTKK